MISILGSLRSKVSSLLGMGFARSVGILLGGTAFAQILTALALPVLSRLYAPSDFSVLAVYASVLAIISVAACLRFDVAIPLPEDESDAANLLGLALSFSALTAFTVGAVVIFFPSLIIDLVQEPRLKPYLWLLPIGIWLTSSYAALQFWTVRAKAFGLIARTRVTQAVSGVGTQVTLGALGITPFGLLLGHALNSGAGIVGLTRGALKSEARVIKSMHLTRMQRMFKEFARFPKFSTLEAIGNVAAVQLPVILIAAYAVGPEAGFLMLAMRAMQAPMAMLGAAVSQVYLSRAPEEFRSGNLAPFTLKVVVNLAKAGVGPLILAGMVAPMLFPVIFGAEWTRAGILVSWMVPWFIMQFISAPVSAALHVTGHQRAALMLQVLGFIIRVGSVLAAIAFGSVYVAEVFAMSSFLFHTIVFVMTMRYAGIRYFNASSLLAALPIISYWVFLGFAIVIGARALKVLA